MARITFITWECPPGSRLSDIEISQNIGGSILRAARIKAEYCGLMIPEGSMRKAPFWRFDDSLIPEVEAVLRLWNSNNVNISAQIWKTTFQEIPEIHKGEPSVLWITKETKVFEKGYR